MHDQNLYRNNKPMVKKWLYLIFLFLKQSYKTGVYTVNIAEARTLT